MKMPRVRGRERIHEVENSRINLKGDIMRKTFRNILILSTAVLVGSTAAHAQVLDEVVVVAQKREQNLQDVGIAVTAFSGDQMNALGFEDSRDIFAQTPGLNYVSPLGPGLNGNAIIRGIGFNDFNDGIEAPVVTYIDEMYIVPISAVDFALFDLERSEVLKGPQGTLFGRNATGGLTHFITAKPTDEFEANLNLTVAEFEETKIDGAVSGPLGDRAQARLSFFKHDIRDGYQENIGSGEDGGLVDSWGVRGQLAFQPTDTVDILLKYEHGENDNVPIQYERIPTTLDADGFEISLDPSDPLYGCAGCDLLGTSPFGSSPGHDGTNNQPNLVNSQGENNLESEADTVNLRIDWDLGGMTLTSITGWMDYSKRNAQTEFCGMPVSWCSLFDANYSSEQWTQEIRLSGEGDRTRWTVGGFYLDQDSEYDLTALFGLEFVPESLAVSLTPEWQQELQSYAIFGQAEFDVNDTITLIGGVRWGNDKKDFEQTYIVSDPADLFGVGAPVNDPSFFTAYPFTKAAVGDLTEIDEDLWSAKAEIDWKPNDDTLIYASISRGSKAGGFNNGPTNNFDPANVPFDSESILSYEIGAKLTGLFNDTSRLNSAIFYYDYEDYQAFVFSGLGGITKNQDANAWGGEVEFYTNPVEGLEMSLGVSYVDAEVEDFPTPNTGAALEFGAPAPRDFFDAAMANTPEWTVNGLIRYELPVGNSGLLASAQWDFSYADERFQDSQQNPSTLMEDYIVHNARVSLYDGEDKWSVSAFVKNIGDSEHVVLAFPLAGFCGCTQLMHNPPRWAGVQVGVNF